MYVEGLALIDERPTICRHVNQRTLRDLPDGLVQNLQVIGNLVNLLEKRRKGESVLSTKLKLKHTLPHSLPFFRNTFVPHIYTLYM